jgi:pimeloyl-ACP methyl ester carboxylesterase
MADAVVNGVRIAYDVHGEGEPLLLCCGLGEPAFAWGVSILPALVDAGFQVVTFDNRGVAPSEAPPAPYTVADHAADAAALVEHLGLGPCRVAGHSLGAWICELLAADRPDLVRAAALIAGCNPSTEWEKVSAVYGRDLAALDVPLPRYQSVIELLQYVPRAAVQDDAQVAGYVALFGDDPPWPNPGRLGQWEAAVAWTHDDDKPQRWARISVPTLLVAFEHDIDSPPAHARIAAAAIPGAELVEIPGCTHLGPFEQPGVVAAALVDFFRAH